MEENEIYQKDNAFPGAIFCGSTILLTLKLQAAGLHSLQFHYYSLKRRYPNDHAGVQKEKSYAGNTQVVYCHLFVVFATATLHFEGKPGFHSDMSNDFHKVFL